MDDSLKEGSYPLNRSQRLMWTSQQLIKEARVNNMAFRFEIFQQLDVEKFQRAFQELVKEADCMRMEYHFPIAKELPALALRSDFNYAIPCIDLRNEASANEVCTQLIDELTQKSFQAGEVLFTAKLFWIKDAHFVLYLKQHHFITDGWSMGLQIEWLHQRYQELVSKSAEESQCTQFGSFSEYLQSQGSRAPSDKWAVAKEYWTSFSDGLSLAPKLLGRTNALLEPSSTVIKKELSQELTASLKTELQAADIRSFSTDLALVTLLSTVCYAFAYRLSGQSELCLGMPFHGRMDAEQMRTPGVFMELFPTKVSIKAGETFGSLLEKVRASFFETLRHAEPGSGADAIAKSCNFYFNYINAKLNQGDGFADQVNWLHSGVTEPTHHLIVKLYDFEDKGRYTLQFDLNNAVFPCSYQEIVVEQFIDELERCLEDRSQPIDAAGPGLLKRLDSFHYPAINPARSDFDTVLSLFEEQVKTRPEAIAATFEGEDLSYRELDKRSNQLARLLLDQGLRPGDIVGICVHRSFMETMVIIAILKSGGAFLPLDPDYPQSRVDFILDDSGTKFVVHESHYAESYRDKEHTSLDLSNLEQESAQYSSDPLAENILTNQLFHVYYTSGSTGRPKGVLVRHDGVLNCLLGMQQEFPLSVEDVTVRKTVLNFDSAVWETFWPLITGSRFVIAKHNHQGDTEYISKLMKEEGVTLAYFVAPLLDKYLKEEGAFFAVKRVISGGDELKAAVVKRFQERFRDIQLYNYYGPTEGSIGCTAWKMPKNYQAANPIPIGRPFLGTRIYILNDENNHCLVGVPGELCLGGVQVAEGYLNRPNLTAEKFTTLTIAGAEGPQYLYRTGDLARWTEVGDIEYLGRIDNQVKIRGVRIELGELEYVLKQVKGVLSASAIARSLKDEEKKLIAYLVTNELFDRNECWEMLARELPSYLIPNYIMEIAEIPLLPNGKLDRKSLPLPDKVAKVIKGSGPTTEFETIIYEQWKRLFTDTPFGISTNFFDLGGHSLTGLKLINELNDIFELDLPASAVFRFPTIVSLAIHIEDTIRKLLAEMDAE